MDALLPLAPTATPIQSTAAPMRQVGAAFADLLETLVTTTDAQQRAADQSAQGVHSGGDKNLHQAMIAMEQADISLRYMVQVRNKAIEAYQEIMRMQL